MTYYGIPARAARVLAPTPAPRRTVDTSTYVVGTSTNTIIDITLPIARKQDIKYGLSWAPSYVDRLGPKYGCSYHYELSTLKVTFWS